MAETKKKDPKLIAMNSVRANGNSVAMDTNIAVPGKGLSEDQFYAAHSGEKLGFFRRLFHRKKG